MRAHFTSKRKGKATTGKVIPELAFAFWEKMFNGRFDARIWNNHLINVMPHLPAGLSVQAVRNKINTDLNKIRGLRNRIAHHEPIFNRPLATEFAMIEELFRFRCPVTAAWMVTNQQATPFFGTKPP